jgi:hypothetical protein
MIPTSTLRGTFSACIAALCAALPSAASAASTLTLLSPDGVTTTHNLAGTGAREFPLRKSGDWTLTLEMADGRTLTSVVTVTESPFVLVVR